MEPLACNQIVFRALRPSWVDRQTMDVLPIAFVRRHIESGLSVNVASAESCSKTLRRCGVGSLHVGRIRDLGLDVVVDSHPHAEIAGVPTDIENPAEANRLAFSLARRTRFVPPDLYTNPAAS